MPQIVISDEQAQLVVQATEPVQVRDASGRVLGVISPVPSSDQVADIEEMKRRMKAQHRWYSTDEVLDHLRSLETR